MSAFREISPQEWQGNAFSAIGTQWMLICTQQGDKINLMTASWGGLGILWSKPVAHCYVRPQRFTRELLDPSDSYSLLFFDESYRKQLNLCGTKSGRDMDKVAACGFTPATLDGVPYMEEASLAVFCRKLYAQDLLAECFVDKSIIAECYPGSDFHRAYVGQITKMLER